jgi:hypothetical protein
MRVPVKPSMLVSAEMELKFDSSASMSPFVGSQPLCTFGTPVLEQRFETRRASLIGITANGFSLCPITNEAENNR